VTNVIFLTRLLLIRSVGHRLLANRGHSFLIFLLEVDHAAV